MEQQQPMKEAHENKNLRAQLKFKGDELKTTYESLNALRQHVEEQNKVISFLRGQETSLNRHDVKKLFSENDQLKVLLKNQAAELIQLKNTNDKISKELNHMFNLNVDKSS